MPTLAWAMATYPMAIGPPRLGPKPPLVTLPVGSPSMATITIVDDDTVGAPGTLQFSPSSYTVNEGGSEVTVSISRVGGTTGAVSASYSTEDVSASAGRDYTAVSGNVNFADGDNVPKTVTISILDDTSDESNESLQVSLSGPTVGSPSVATVTIVDNDNPPATESGGSGAFSLTDFALILFIMWFARPLRSRRAD